jgi:hypothetical protein
MLRQACSEKTQRPDFWGVPAGGAHRGQRRANPVKPGLMAGLKITGPFINAMARKDKGRRRTCPRQVNEDMFLDRRGEGSTVKDFGVHW